jgi:hypothetical protein
MPADGQVVAKLWRAGGLLGEFLVPDEVRPQVRGTDGPPKRAIPSLPTFRVVHPIGEAAVPASACASPP